MRRALAAVLAAAAIGCAAAQPPSLGPLYVESHARPGDAHGTKEFRTSVAEKPLTAPAVVVVPRDVYAGAEALEVRWIDFYR